LTAEQADAGHLPPAPETNPLEREFFSVTDDTTRHLADKQKVKRQSDN